jgi:HK97 family phage major capsid protein
MRTTELSELNAKIDQLVDTFKEVREQHATRINELEKRAAREREYVPTNTDAPSLGQLVIDSNGIKDINSGFRGKASFKFPDVEMAAITSGSSTVGNNTSPGTSLVPAHRVRDIVTPYQRELRIRDVINVAQTTSNSVEWPAETAFTNNARPVTEGQGKPYSDLTFELRSAPVRTIAHMFKASRQILDDAPALASYINRRGTYGLLLKEEAQILTGNNTGQNLNGIVPQATAFAPSFTVDHETAIDRILEAISQAEDAEIPVNAVVLNKRDWRRITGIKDEEGRYISGQSPFGLTDPRLWGVNIVPTNAMPAGEFLAGAFQDGATIFDRMGVEVLLSTENSDDFEKNLCSLRIESRLALATFRPDAFVSGDLYVTSE